MDTKTQFLASLQAGPIVGDGGMGTQLILRGLPVGVSAEQWGSQNPAAVEDVHQCYLEAGCQVLTTNSFGGSPITLAKHGLADQTAQLNRSAAESAKRVAKDSVWVLGSVGPCGEFLEPYGDLEEDELVQALRIQMGALREGGADGIVIETMVDERELSLAVQVACELGDWPVVASFAFNHDAQRGFATIMGVTPPRAIHAARSSGAACAGANCGTSLGLPLYLELAKELVQVSDGFPVVMQPNAGAPEQTSDGPVYRTSPGEMAQLALKIRDAGVRYIGGCCGTTPDHLKAMATALKAV